ncbi:MAG: PadR family transcriptional regulator [Dactylosporangium sp.]|nr:PadR family transcriptional regulator [Dactylosporangium sp.]NNJ63418.1 PadR family transcriptional regulator [Dactylosporangium sp.]
MMILGLVRWLAPVHGYDLRRELMSWNVEAWASIQPGSVYHALKKLTAEGMLEEVATERVGARPARTTYRMTPRGEIEFDDLLHRYWWGNHPAIDPFSAAFALLPAMPRTEAVLACRNRARVLRAQSHGLRDSSADDLPWTEHKPVHVRWMFEITTERAEIEAAWCERVADRIEAGEGVFVGEGDAAMARAGRQHLNAGPSTTSESDVD